MNNEKEFIKRDDKSRIDLGLKPIAEISDNKARPLRPTMWLYYVVALIVVAKFVNYLVS